MAEVIFNELISSVRGKYCKQDENGAIFTRRNGKNFVHHIHNPHTGPATAKQLAHQEKFKSMQAQVATIMVDDEQVASYKEAFVKQTKYATLRGYIFAQLMANPGL